jgi:hypothetical protein
MSIALEYVSPGDKRGEAKSIPSSTLPIGKACRAVSQSRRNDQIDWPLVVWISFRIQLRPGRDHARERLRVQSQPAVGPNSAPAVA